MIVRPMRVLGHDHRIVPHRIADNQLVLCQLLIYGFSPIAEALVACLSRTPYGFGSVSRQP